MTSKCIRFLYCPTGELKMRISFFLIRRIPGIRFIDICLFFTALKTLNILPPAIHLFTIT